MESKSIPSVTSTYHLQYARNVLHRSHVEVTPDIDLDSMKTRVFFKDFWFRVCYRLVWNTCYYYLSNWTNMEYYIFLFQTGYQFVVEFACMALG